MKNFAIIKWSKAWLTVSAVMIALSLGALARFGLQYGVDFTGGSLLELRIPNTPPTDALREIIERAGFTEITVQSSEGDRVLVRAPELSEQEHQEMITAVLAHFPDALEEQYTFVGPSVGAELRTSAFYAVGLLLILITLYVAWAFRNVHAHQVSSWKFGGITLLAAAHDVIIPLGVFAVLGRVWGYQVDTAFVAAILTILGYSINDTIVVFDRTREHLGRMRSGETFRAIVERSIKETIGRSVNTTVAVLIPLVAIFVLGGESTRPFVLALMLGIISGAYSSLFVASPLLVSWQEHSAKK